MKSFLKFSKVCMAGLACALFLGIGIKADAAGIGKVTGLKQIDDNSGSVTLQWDAPAGDIAGYVLEYCQDKNFTGSTYNYGSTTQKAAKIPDLEAGKSYYVRVTAVNSQDKGLASDVVEAVTAPSAKPSGLKQTKAEAKKISLSWKKVAGANAYVLDYYKKSNSAKKKDITVGDVSSYKLTMAANTKYSVAVFPARKSSSGYIAYGENYVAKDMSTLPKKVSKVKMITSGSKTNANAGIVYFSWGRSDAAEGYEYTIYNNKGKKMLKKTTSSYSPVMVSNGKLKNDQFMKIRVRAYITVNGKKKYGPLSDVCWFAKYPDKVTKAMVGKTASEGVRISWKKMDGARDYTVYVSTNENSGWKKAGTTKGNSYVIKSCGGSPITTGITYYYKVVASKKVGKKTYKSDSGWYDAFRITTYYY